MSWKLSAVVALGCVMVCQGPAWANGEAEAPPSPGQARRPPSAAEVPERPDEKPLAVPAKPPSPARTASPSKVGSDVVKTMLPADYRDVYKRQVLRQIGRQQREHPEVREPVNEVRNKGAERQRLVDS